MRRARNIYEKIWESHLVHEEAGRATLLYIDTHLVHEVTSPQAFEGLRLAGRSLRRPERTFATMDHNIPTTNRTQPIADPLSKLQIETLRENCRQFGVTLFDMDSEDRGIVHIIGPELGLTKPGATIVCGDSHTSTHGAFGALAFGIGTSEVEHVLATQTLPQSKSKAMEIRIDGQLPIGVTAKDVILHIIGKLGTAGATGFVIEYTGEVVRYLSMEQRMTICNMSIEAGARAGLISPDDTTFEYLKGRRYIPDDRPWEQLKAEWAASSSDEGCDYDKRVMIGVSEIEPQVTWGTSPGMVTGISGSTPVTKDMEVENERLAVKMSLKYMGLDEGVPLKGLKIDAVFLGSCTNSRIEDLRAGAEIARGYQVAPGVRTMVVPGSQAVKYQAEKEGLDSIFKRAGFEWREAGCSMCLGMNPDYLQPGERCASTSNRNFEGRQGSRGRTHLVSPAMAIAAAIRGAFVDVREWELK